LKEGRCGGDSPRKVFLVRFPPGDYPLPVLLTLLLSESAIFGLPYPEMDEAGNRIFLYIPDKPIFSRLFPLSETLLSTFLYRTRGINFFNTGSWQVLLLFCVFEPLFVVKGLHMLAASIDSIAS